MQQDRQGGMMQQDAPGRMGPGMMGRHMGGHMDHGAMMPVLFAIMDADGDGPLTLEEVQEIHARIIRHVDADDDGKVTPDEIRAFFHRGRDADDSDE